MGRQFTNTIETKTCVAGIGQLVEFQVGGSLCIIREASAAFDLQFDHDEKVTYEAGFEIDTGLDPFTRVRCYNKSATEALTVSLSLGTGSGVRGVRSQYLRTRKTKLVAATAVFDGTGTASFPGVATTAAKYSVEGVSQGSRRRQFVVTNLSTAATINIQTALGGAVLGVLGIRASALSTPPAFTLETDCDFVIVGTPGEQYSVCELFYV